MVQGQVAVTGPDLDVLIVGGGMVGASMAVALQPLGLRVGMVEAVPFKQTTLQPAYDDRSVALSHGSSLIYQELGLWEALRGQVEAIQRIHVSDRGYFGATRLSAEQERVPALGYVVESRVLGGVLYAALAAGETEILSPATVTAVGHNDDAHHLWVDIDRDGLMTRATCRLLIVADGARSRVRDLLGIAVRERDYRQSAVIANVSTAEPHRQQAYER
ncbi:MAG: FAD-dependent monooxygenase, partial [Thiolinea sp.]